MKELLQSKTSVLLVNALVVVATLSKLVLLIFD